MYLHPHLHLNPHWWFRMLDSKALLADSWWWYIQWSWPIRMQYKHWQSRGEEESYTKLIDMYSEIQLDHKQQYEQSEIIDINGVGRLYPFKISMSPWNKSTLFQQDTSWTCGPYTLVKVGLFRQFFDYILMRAFHLVASVLIRGLSMKTG